MKRVDKVRFECSRCKSVTKRNVAIKYAGKRIPSTCKNCGLMETFEIPVYRKKSRFNPQPPMEPAATEPIATKEEA